MKSKVSAVKTVANGKVKAIVASGPDLARRKKSEAGDRLAKPVIDLESRLTRDHDQSLKLWLRLLSCTVRIEDELRARLRNTFDITLPRFDLMSQLERYPDGLRMGELSKRMMVTGGNITGITDQLEQEKLVARVADPFDRRAFSVKLTRSGHRAYARMASQHEAWVAELLGGISSSDKTRLIKLLSGIKDHLHDATDSPD